MVLSIILGLSGCNSNGPSKEDLQAENESLLASIVEYEDEVAYLKSALDAVNGTDTNYSAITSVSDGSKAETFQSINGKILFNTELTYTDSSQAPNNSALRLTDKINIVPSNNWVIQMNGTTTNFSHPNGIYGTIKVVSIEQLLKGEEVEANMLKPFTDSIPYTSKIDSKIYINNIWRGMSSELTILNNNKPAVIKCGLYGVGETGVIYTFYYDGDKDSTKTELVNNLLKTMRYGEQEVTLE